MPLEPSLEPALPASSLLDPRRLVLSTVAVLAAVMATVAVLGYFFREPLLHVSELFVQYFAGPGIAIGYFLPDAFTLPLPNDVVTLLGLNGGMGFVEVCAWATGGSLAGGATGYWIGRYLRGTKLVRRIFEKTGGQAQAILDRYGALAVAVAAVTPLPYSIFCWAAGAGRLRFSTFLLVSQLRVIRVAGYLYLLQLGLFSTMGL
jgi:membrane protein YqaA with SNARE-associated domain